MIGKVGIENKNLDKNKIGASVMIAPISFLLFFTVFTIEQTLS